MEKENRKKVKLLDFVVDLIHRYEKGEVNEPERQALDTWEPAEDGFDSRMPAGLNKEIWRRLNKQRHHLSGEEITARPLLRRLWTASRQYAAIFLVLFLVGNAVWLFIHHIGFFRDDAASMVSERQIWTTTDRRRMELTLIDGTVIWMNAGSSMEILKHQFNKEKREVWLSGEAFFEVAKNAEKPFIIHTGDIKTVVRGTSFNIKAYPVLNEKVVTVRDGKVEINKGGRTLGLLIANQELKYNKTDDKTKIRQADWQDAAGWTEGRLILNGIRADELRLRLHQQFNVNVIIESRALDGIYLQGAFGREASLREVMNTISTVYDIEYETKGNNLIIKP